MTDINPQAKIPEDIYCVRDLWKVFFAFLLVTIVFFGLVMGSGLNVPVLLVALVMGLMRLKVVWEGIVFNVADKTIEFPGEASPGEGYLLNNAEDFLSPKKLFQFLFRFKINLDEIRMIYPSQKRGFSLFLSMLSAGRPSRQTSALRPFYYLELNGSFGAAKLRFNSEGKRDEAYSFLIQHNKMGIPVSSR